MLYSRKSQAFSKYPHVIKTQSLWEKLTRLDPSGGTLFGCDLGRAGLRPWPGGRRLLGGGCLGPSLWVSWTPRPRLKLCPTAVAP